MADNVVPVMGEVTGIKWTDHTFNPWEGCQKVGPGCDHCYAETRNARYGGGIAPNWGPGAPRRRTGASNWRKPLKWNKQAEAEGKRHKVFCASLADVFDNAVDPQWRADLFELIRQTPWLDWQLLTKRIGNVLDMLPDDWGDGYPNVWLGITVVNQDEADRDIPKLLQIPARIRFLSMEPLLGSVDLTRLWSSGGAVCWNAMRGRKSLGQLSMYAPKLDWVVVGGESGRGARPMHPDWARSLRDQCAAAGVPFFFKQWGEWLPLGQFLPDAGKIHGATAVIPGRMKLHYGGTAKQAPKHAFAEKGVSFASTGDNKLLFHVGTKASGSLLDGVEHFAFPEVRAG